MKLPSLTTTALWASLSLFHLVQATAEEPKPTLADVSYGEHKLQAIDFWKAEGDGPRPIHIHIHGGGWIGGDKKSLKNVQKYLDKGVSVASVNYRLSGEHPLPVPVHDAAYAVQFIKSKAEEWNIDKNKVVLTGGSAGACTSMWILLHDDLADPKSEDPVKRESTRVQGAAVAGGQTAIDPPLIEGWLGPMVKQHNMISRAVGEPNIEAAMKNYEKHKALYHEFSPYNHLDKNDPPLFMSYNNNMTLPSESAGHGIHHPVYGVKLKEKADSVGHESHLLIRDVSQPEKYPNPDAFVFGILLGE